MVYFQTLDISEERHKFEILYLKYRGLMFYIANQILNNEHDAEDAVHGAFVSIAENLKKIGNPVCPKTRAYVVTIVERKAIDIYRHRRRRMEIPIQEGTLSLTVTYDGSHAIAGCFTKLPAQARHILLLKYRYGYHTRDIARFFRITEANAIKRIQRAKKKLYDLCREEGIR